MPPDSRVLGDQGPAERRRTATGARSACGARATWVASAGASRGIVLVRDGMDRSGGTPTLGPASWQGFIDLAKKTAPWADQKSSAAPASLMDDGADSRPVVQGNH